MKKNLLSAVLVGLFSIWASNTSAQMFYNARSSFDTTGSTSYKETVEKPSKDDTSEENASPFEALVSKGIRERIKSDAAYIIGEPEETLCYGIARKSPKKRKITKIIDS